MGYPDDADGVMKELLQKLQIIDESGEIDRDKIRKKIRSYFFPLVAPKELNDSWWDTLTMLVLGGGSLGFIVGIISSGELAVISLIGLGAGFGILGWLDDEILNVTKERNKFTDKEGKTRSVISQMGIIRY